MDANKPLYIIDASVILKWFLSESSCSEEALEIRYDYFRHKITLGTVDYAYAEVLNALGRSFARDKAMVSFSSLLQYQLWEYALSIEIAGIAVGLMKKFPGISFYDAGYHALALHKGAHFITADKKYYNRAKSAKNLLLLKDYGKKR